MERIEKLKKFYKKIIQIYKHLIQETNRKFTYNRCNLDMFKIKD